MMRLLKLLKKLKKLFPMTGRSVIALAGRILYWEILIRVCKILKKLFQLILKNPRLFLNWVYYMIFLVIRRMLPIVSTGY
jgi:hypothetical protein